MYAVSGYCTLGVVHRLTDKGIHGTLTIPNREVPACANTGDARHRSVVPMSSAILLHPDPEVNPLPRKFCWLEAVDALVGKAHTSSGTWLTHAIDFHEEWLRITLSYYDQAYLTGQEVEHLELKARGFCGPSPMDPDLLPAWEYLRQQVYGYLRRWIPTEYKRRYYQYLRSPQWKATRSKVLRAANHTCAECGGEASQVHHLSYSHIGSEQPGDLVALCADCHRYIHRDKLLGGER